MDFFKSILSDDPTDPPQSPPISPHSSSSAAATTSSAAASAWSFGGLIKTLATQSESVLEIYRRDLQEFKSGLQKETAALRDVAARLPSDLDTVLKSTADIISHRTDSLLLSPQSSSDPDPDTNPSSRRYSRFELHLRAIEGDSNTYCSGPEDSEDFEKWKAGFVLGEEREENETIKGVYNRVVPDLVDDETFWLRYYYRVHKLKQQESLRANLVKRAISVDLDEELSWDVDDEDDDDDKDSVRIEKTVEKEVVVSEIDEKGEKESIFKGVDTSETPKKEESEKPVKIEDLACKIEEKEEKETNLEKGVDSSEVSKSEEKGDSDLSIVSTQPTLPEEEDMGWDEIEEEVGSGDEKREKLSGSPNRADLRKRLSVADDDEDLSWDIEDDDEPVSNPGAK